MYGVLKTVYDKHTMYLYPTQELAVKKFNDMIKDWWKLRFPDEAFNLDGYEDYFKAGCWFYDGNNYNLFVLGPDSIHMDKE